MDKIFYIDNILLSKCNRCKWCNYTIVSVVDKLTFGNVKVSTWGFDIKFAYAPVNHIGYDVVEENDIKELNWDNIINDFNNSYHNRKYIIWDFLMYNYPLDSSLIDKDKDTYQIVYWDRNEIAKRIYDNANLPDWCKNKDTYQIVYWDDVEIARRKYDNNNLPEWCKGQDILWKIDCVIDYMIDHNIEKENCKQLKELIRTDAVTFTTEDYMRMKGYIK